jgi:hypothetical protein
MSIPHKSARLGDGGVLVLSGGYWSGTGESFRRNYARHDVIVSLKIIAPSPLSLSEFHRMSEGAQRRDEASRTVTLCEIRGHGVLNKADYATESRCLIRERGLRHQFNRLVKEMT